MSEGVNFYVVPATTINAMLNHLMEKPYREVAEVVKLMEGTIIQVPAQMNILRELSRAAAPKVPDAPPPPPRDGGPVEDAGNVTDLRS